MSRSSSSATTLALHTSLLLMTVVTTTVVSGGFLGAELLGSPWADAQYYTRVLGGLLLPCEWVLLWIRYALEDGLSTSGFAFGWRFSLALLSILGCHEAGHYLACRRYRLPASLPYFLPAPFGIGTFGAVIRIEAMFRSKRELFDVAAAGPIAGVIAMLPFLVYGMANSQIDTTVIPITSGFLYSFSEPLLFQTVNFLLPVGQGSLELHPFAWASWFGMLVTAFNLLPMAQLDGGHIAYSVLGARHRRIGLPLLALLFLAGFGFPGFWVMGFFVILMGIHHPRIPDEAIPLDRTRKWVALLCLLLLLICGTPLPIKVIEIGLS